ncbi:hypothetical protein CRG98_025534 [Punica granatum]|uniref:Uncharacterized protein n=2 Tax=Punica granatum TaxID=22663 RepID=A0A2I0JDN7_PUNGR|nr:hypothetical protein CRG98_025534 [Punica granatum]
MGIGMAVDAGATAKSLCGTWVSGTQGAGSTIDPCARGGVELEDTQFGPPSKAVVLELSVPVMRILEAAAKPLTMREVHPLKSVMGDRPRTPLDKLAVFLLEWGEGPAGKIDLGMGDLPRLCPCSVQRGAQTRYLSVQPAASYAWPPERCSRTPERLIVKPAGLGLLEAEEWARGLAVGIGPHMLKWCEVCPCELISGAVSLGGNVLQATELSDHSGRKDKHALQVVDEGKPYDCWTPNGHEAVEAPASFRETAPVSRGVYAVRLDVWEKPYMQEARGPPHPVALTRLYIVEGPHDLSHEGFHVTTASYRFGGRCGKYPVYEGRGAREQKGLNDEKEKLVVGITSVGVFCGAECTDIGPVDEPCSPDAVLPSVAELLVGLLDADA